MSSAECGVWWLGLWPAVPGSHRDLTTWPHSTTTKISLSNKLPFIDSILSWLDSLSKNNDKLWKNLYDCLFRVFRHQTSSTNNKSRIDWKPIKWMFLLRKFWKLGLLMCLFLGSEQPSRLLFLDTFNNCFGPISDRDKWFKIISIYTQCKIWILENYSPLKMVIFHPLTQHSATPIWRKNNKKCCWHKHNSQTEKSSTLSLNLPTHKSRNLFHIFLYVSLLCRQGAFTVFCNLFDISCV